MIDPAVVEREKERMLTATMKAETNSMVAALKVEMAMCFALTTCRTEADLVLFANGWVDGTEMKVRQMADDRVRAMLN